MSENGYSDCCFMIDNLALYKICQTSLGVETPNYASINRLIAQVRIEKRRINSEMTLQILNTLIKIDL